MGWRDLKREIYTERSDGKTYRAVDFGPLGVAEGTPNGRSKAWIKEALEEGGVNEGEAIFNCLMSFDQRWAKKQRYPHFNEPPTETESGRLDDSEEYAELIGEGSCTYLAGNILFQLICRENIVVGICIRNRKNLDEKVFIDRDPAMDTASLMDELHRLCTMNLQVEDGVLVAEQAGVRLRMRTLGVLEAPTAKKTLALPARYSETRVRTPASHDDSEGKAQWRSTLLQAARLHFPEGPEAIAERDRYVFCFAGAGEEIKQWEAFGFPEDHVVVIERDRVNAVRQQQRFPNARWFIGDFEEGGSRQALMWASNQGVRFSIVSIDPESQLTRPFYAALRRMTTAVANRVVVSTNFYGKREGANALGVYHAIGAMDGSLPQAINAARDFALKNAMKAAFKEEKKPFHIDQEWHGKYTGEGNAPMQWATACYTLPTPRK